MSTGWWGMGVQTHMLGGRGPWSVDSSGEGGGGSWAGQLAWVSMTSDCDPRAGHPHGAPIQRLSSLPETQPWAPRPWPLSLLVTGGPLPESLLPKDPAPEDDTSNLTHGNYPISARS